MKFICPLCNKDLRQPTLIIGDGEEVMRLHLGIHLKHFAIKASDILPHLSRKYPKEIGLVELAGEAEKLGGLV